MTQHDPIPNGLKNDPTAARLLGDPAALKALLSSPETRQLMSLLNRNGGLQGAAQAAAKGEPEALMGMLQQVMRDQAGAAAVDALKKKTQK